MQTWKMAVLVGAATATAVGGAAIAFAGDHAGDRGRSAPASVAQAAPGDSDERYGAPEGGSARGMGEGLQESLQDPDLRADLEQLRDEARAAMDDWRHKYGGEPTSDEAREALQKLWEKQRAAMEKLMQKYGLEWDDLGSGHGAGHGNGNDRSTSTATQTAATF